MSENFNLKKNGLLFHSLVGWPFGFLQVRKVLVQGYLTVLLLGMEQGKTSLWGGPGEVKLFIPWGWEAEGKREHEGLSSQDNLPGWAANNPLPVGSCASHSLYHLQPGPTAGDQFFHTWALQGTFNIRFFCQKVKASAREQCPKLPELSFM